MSLADRFAVLVAVFFLSACSQTGTQNTDGGYDAGPEPISGWILLDSDPTLG